MKVELTSSEIMLAAMAGVMRQVENMKRGRKEYYGAAHETDWQLNIEGCLGEMALSKHLGIYWYGKGTFRGDDVGRDQVRTAMQDNYRLILHPEDLDDKKYWLLTGINGSYTIRGWLLGKDGKKKEYWTDPLGGRPAFFVPQSALNPPPPPVETP